MCGTCTTIAKVDGGGLRWNTQARRGRLGKAPQDTAYHSKFCRHSTVRPAPFSARTTWSSPASPLVRERGLSPCAATGSSRVCAFFSVTAPSSRLDLGGGDDSRVAGEARSSSTASAPLHFRAGFGFTRKRGACGFAHKIR